MGLGVTAIVLSLGLLMVVAYRGFPVIVFAPLLALLAVALSGLPLLPSFTESFMGHAAGYIKSFFPLFLLGAIFGKLMETSGAAGSIAEATVRALGSRRAIAAVVFSCGILTYGGVSLFVVAFAVYPFAAVHLSRSRDPQAADPGHDRPGLLHLHDGCSPGLAADPELDPDPLLRDRCLCRPVRRPGRRFGDLDRRTDLARVPPGAGGRGRRGVWRPSRSRAVAKPNVRSVRTSSSRCCRSSWSWSPTWS